MLPTPQVPVNSSLSELTLHFELSTTPAWKHLVMSQLEQSFSMQRSLGAMADGDSDDVKRIFIESNPWFLALTMAVSLLHSGERGGALAGRCSTRAAGEC